MAKVETTIKNASKITSLVNQLIEKELLEIDGQDIKVFKGLLYGGKRSENFIKNCYTYMRLTNRIKEGIPFTVYDIENGDILGTFAGNATSLQK